MGILWRLGHLFKMHELDPCMKLTVLKELHDFSGSWTTLAVI
jgi:hypothetical protein